MRQAWRMQARAAGRDGGVRRDARTGLVPLFVIVVGELNEEERLVLETCMNQHAMLAVCYEELGAKCATESSRIFVQAPLFDGAALLRERVIIQSPVYHMVATNPFYDACMDCVCGMRGINYHELLKGGHNSNEMVTKGGPVVMVPR